MKDPAAQQSLPFGNVLVARSPHETPSELELQMRRRCQRLRVVANLLGGAHLLLPGSETTIAVRSYDQADVERLDKRKPDMSSREQVVKRIAEWHRMSNPQSGNDDSKKDDLDGLEAFRDAFKNTVVFFILPPGSAQSDQLSVCDSFVNRAQMAMARPCSRSNKEGAPHAGAGFSSARVFVVPTVETAMDTLESIVDHLKPHKRNKVQEYFDREATAFFIPDVHTGRPPKSPNGASSHVASAFQSWAQRMEISTGDANVLMGILDTLSAIATADHNVLDTLPIEQEAKDLLLGFFGADDDRAIVPGLVNDAVVTQQQDAASTSFNHQTVNTMGQLPGASSQPNSQYGIMRPPSNHVTAMPSSTISGRQWTPMLSSLHGTASVDTPQLHMEPSSNSSQYSSRAHYFQAMDAARPPSSTPSFASYTYSTPGQAQPRRQFPRSTSVPGGFASSGINRFQSPQPPAQARLSRFSTGRKNAVRTFSPQQFR